MTQELRNLCYKFYIEHKDMIDEEQKERELSEFLTTNNLSLATYTYLINNIERIQDRNKNIITFGIELEYAGMNTACNQNHPLTQTMKYDGSVADDGREWNLHPKRLDSILSKEYKTNIESWMVTATKHGCLIHKTAGQHIHFGATDMCDNEYYDEYDDEENAIDSETMREIGQCVQNVFCETISKTWKNEEGINVIWEKRILLKDKLSDEEPEKTKKCVNALKFLYSVSNRDGTESYGLGRDGTRGYTRHGTVEIRAFRTTTDYRSVIARTIVSKFFLEWCSKTEMERYISWDEIPDIWEELQKEENKVVKDMYTYLAFHTHNKHKVGMTEEELRLKLNIPKPVVRAIKSRSSMIAKSLLNNAPEKVAKELFKF
jgi:hypothetical protein